MRFSLPGFEFALLASVLLIAWLVWASWWDYRTMRVPKKVTMSLLAAGVLMNVVRGAWVGGVGKTVWMFDAPGPFLGALDGLLFALIGLVVGFFVFFAMWVLGAAGGGDVKLSAALGAWLGPVYFFGVLFLALPIVVLLTILKIGTAVTMGKVMETAGGPRVSSGGGRRILSYSLPITLAVVILLIVALSRVS